MKTLFDTRTDDKFSENKTTSYLCECEKHSQCKPIKLVCLGKNKTQHVHQ